MRRVYVKRRYVFPGSVMILMLSLVMTGIFFAKPAAAKHEMVGRWGMDKSCGEDLVEIVIMAENRIDVMFVTDSHGKKKVVRLNTEPQEEGNPVYRERVNPERTYHVNASNHLVVQDNGEILCLGKPRATSGRLELPTHSHD